MAGGANIGGFAGFIAKQIIKGVGPTAALAEFRAAGGAVRTQRWFQVFKETADAVARANEFANLSGHLRPADSMFSEWSTRRPGLYGYQIQIVTRDMDTGETILREHTQFYDRKVSPNKAIADSLNDLSEEDGTIGTQATEKIEGAFLKGLYRTIPIALPEF